jgi:hypothetical protein
MSQYLMIPTSGKKVYSSSGKTMDINGTNFNRDLSMQESLNFEIP